MITDSKQKFGEDSITRNIVITDGTVKVESGKLVFENETIKITNDELHSEEFSLVESICSEEQMVFGSCESSEISFKFSANIPDLTNRILHVYMYSDGDVTNIMPIGTYRVATDEATADRRVRSIVGYDLLHDILNADVAEWYNQFFANSSLEKTIRDMRFSFLLHFGIEDATTTSEMPNDGIVITKTMNPSKLSGATVIKALCELNGAFGHMTRDNKFKSLVIKRSEGGLYPSPTLYPNSNLFPVYDGNKLTLSQYQPPLDIKKYRVGRIDRIQINYETGDIGAIAGTGDNSYLITGNFLVYGMGSAKLMTIANNLLTKIGNIEYVPFSVKAKGNPLIEVGDYIRIASDSELFESILMSRKLTGIQSLYDSFSSSGDIKQSRSINSFNEKIEMLNGKTAKIRQDVDEVSTTLEEQLDSTHYGSYAWQTAREIGFKVAKGEVVSEINADESGVKIKGDKVEIEGTFTANRKFVVEEDGTMYCDEARIEDAELSQCVFSDHIRCDDGASEEDSSFYVDSQNMIVETGDVKINYKFGGSVYIYGVSILGAGAAGSGGTRISFDYNETDAMRLTANKIYVGSNATESLSFMGHAVEWKTVKDTSGNTIKVLGY